MPARGVRWALVAAFAAAVGHVAWYGVVGPAVVPQYPVGGDVTALAAPDPSARQLYVRHEYYLGQRPRHAWIQVLGRDWLGVYVNGRFLASQALDGYPVAVVADLTEHLQVGRNVIAIAAKQSSIGKPPLIAVEGAYRLADGEHPIRADRTWRCGTTFERTGRWWFEPEFDERRWPFAPLTSAHLRCTVRQPPRAVTAEGPGRWVTPAATDAGRAAVRREFTVAGRPRQAWLRVTATAAYRLAVNGIPLDEREDRLSTPLPTIPVRRAYDVTTAVRRGGNVVALTLTSPAGPPHLLADLEVVDESGTSAVLGTDETWLSRAGLPTDWLAAAVDDRARWQRCSEESGLLDVPTWQPRFEAVDVNLPWGVWAERVGGQLGLMAAIGLLTWVACGLCGRLLAWVGGTASSGVAYLALVPAAVALGAGVLATYDPRVARQEVYQERWVVLAVASVLAQWLLLCLTAAGRARVVGGGSVCDGAPEHAGGDVWRRRGVTVALAALVAVAFWLRARDMRTEPLMWDEVTTYDATMGFLERGFPSIQTHPDMPTKYFSTSELSFVGPALAALFTKDDHWVVRFPAICFGVGTLPLLYLLGRRMFGVPVGLTAATLYALAPVCITMSNFGRYFSVLQFFTVLTVYCFWRTVRGTGPIDRRALWGTAFSFIGMYLSWECSGLLAPGMVLAALWYRRGGLRTIFCCPAVWAAMLVVGMAVVLQLSHRELQRTLRLEYGMGLQNIKLAPMWLYPTFNFWYYAWETSWSLDAFLPAAGVLGACLLALRHPYREAVRFLLLIYLPTCWLMALLVPATTWRYIHHLVPLAIVLASAALIAAARGLVKLARRPGVPAGWLAYAHGVAALVVLAYLGLANGLTVQCLEMGKFRVEGYGIYVYRFPDLEGPSRYVRDHAAPGDLVFATVPRSVSHFMRDRPVDYWLQSELNVQAALDDRRPLPLDYRSGTVMIADQQSLAEVFARHPRAWFVVVPYVNHQENAPGVSTYLRQNSEVVYEDFSTMVLFRGPNQRPAAQQVRDENALNNARANYLP